MSVVTEIDFCDDRSGARLLQTLEGNEGADLPSSSQVNLSASDSPGGPPSTSTRPRTTSSSGRTIVSRPSRFSSLRERSRCPCASTAIDASRERMSSFARPSESVTAVASGSLPWNTTMRASEIGVPSSRVTTSSSIRVGASARRLADSGATGPSVRIDSRFCELEISNPGVTSGVRSIRGSRLPCELHASQAHTTAARPSPIRSGRFAGRITEA